MASQKSLDKYPIGVYSKVTPTKYPMGVYKNIGRVLCVWNIMNSMSVPTVSTRSEMRIKKSLRRIEGQVRGLQSMLEQDAYCNDILVQSAAVSAALNSFNRELLENHIRHCVARDIREGKDEVIDELMGTLKKLMK